MLFLINSNDNNLKQPADVLGVLKIKLNCYTSASLSILFSTYPCYKTYFYSALFSKTYRLLNDFSSWMLKFNDDTFMLFL